MIAVYAVPAVLCIDGDKIVLFEEEKADAGKHKEKDQKQEKEALCFHTVFSSVSVHTTATLCFDVSSLLPSPVEDIILPPPDFC